MPIAIPITSLPVGTQVLSTDIYVAVDTTDHTDAPTGTDKQYTVSQLNNFLGVNNTSNKLSARVATTASLTAVYNNGTVGVGATLTNSGTFAALVIDGVTLNTNDRVLVKDQVTQTQNGIYVVTNTGSGATNWILTRSSDYNNSTAGQVVEGTFLAISEGTTNIASIWVEVGVNPIVIGTNNIIFQDVSVSFPGVLPLNKGGTNNALVADNGGILYSDATKLDILAHTTTGGQVLQSGASTAPSWSTPTYPSTSGTLNHYLTSDGTNNVYSTHLINLGGDYITQGAVSFLGAFSSTFNFTGATNVTFPTSGTLATTSVIFTWSTVSGTTQAMVANNGYFANNAGLVTFTLPALSSEGDIFEVAGEGTGGWLINYNTAQSIQFINSNSTTTTGHISSIETGASVRLVCMVANTIFKLTSSTGNITIV